jgi:hypothetical protein
MLEMVESVLRPKSTLALVLRTTGALDSVGRRGGVGGSFTAAAVVVVVAVVVGGATVVVNVRSWPGP